MRHSHLHVGILAGLMDRAAMCSYMQQPCHVLLYCRNPLSYRLPAPSSVLASEPLRGVMDYRCPLLNLVSLKWIFFLLRISEFQNLFTGPLSKAVHHYQITSCLIASIFIILQFYMCACKIVYYKIPIRWMF